MCRKTVENLRPRSTHMKSCVRGNSYELKQKAPPGLSAGLYCRVGTAFRPGTRPTSRRTLFLALGNPVGRCGLSISLAFALARDRVATERTVVFRGALLAVEFASHRKADFAILVSRVSNLGDFIAPAGH